MGLEVRGNLSMWQALYGEFYMNHCLQSSEHTQGPRTHRGSDIKTDLKEGRATGMSRGKSGKVKRGKGERKERVFQAKETSCAQICRLEGNERTLWLNHTSFRKDWK